MGKPIISSTVAYNPLVQITESTVALWLRLANHAWWIENKDKRCQLPR